LKALVQRVLRSSVAVGTREISSIRKGILVFLGVGKEDTEKEVEYLAAKVASLRIFEDDGGKMNLSLVDIGGEALVVSQFTLMADTSSGNRPGFALAAPPQLAESLYEAFADRMKALGVTVQMGQFGADMKVELENDGPVTILLESK
jgi:D-tyrosyl-tRNA(Tyr) deacylase